MDADFYAPENPDWDPFNLTVQQAAYAAHKNPSDISSFQGDLSAFRNKGGKIRAFSTSPTI